MMGNKSRFDGGGCGDNGGSSEVGKFQKKFFSTLKYNFVVKRVGEEFHFVPLRYWTLASYTRTHILITYRKNYTSSVYRYTKNVGD